MERVAFLIEETNERLRCLLNPETLVIQRTAGVRPRHALGGLLAGTGLTDDPLLYTGGGRTELQLDLLFDVSLAGSSMITDDVRELTTPLWNLAENKGGPPHQRRPSQVRLLWGKSWDIPGVITAVAERLEQFTPAGTPQRSWLRLCLWRLEETNATQTPAASSSPALTPAELSLIEATPQADWTFHEVRGGGNHPAAETPSYGKGERLEQIAAHYYGDPSLWRLLALVNNIDNPGCLRGGQVLHIPPLSALRGAS